MWRLWELWVRWVSCSLGRTWGPRVLWDLCFTIASSRVRTHHLFRKYLQQQGMWLFPQSEALLGLRPQRDKYASKIRITVIKTVAETTDHKTWLLEAYELPQVAVWKPTLSLVLSVFAFLWFSFAAFMQCVLFATLLLATLRFAILLKGPIDLHQWFATWVRSLQTFYMVGYILLGFCW